MHVIYALQWWRFLRQLWHVTMMCSKPQCFCGEKWWREGEVIYGFKLSLVSRSPLVPRRPPSSSHNKRLHGSMCILILCSIENAKVVKNCHCADIGNIQIYLQILWIFCYPVPQDQFVNLCPAKMPKIWIRRFLKFCRPRLDNSSKVNLFCLAFVQLGGQGVNLAGNLFNNRQSRKGWPLS